MVCASARFLDHRDGHVLSRRTRELVPFFRHWNRVGERLLPVVCGDEDVVNLLQELDNLAGLVHETSKTFLADLDLHGIIVVDKVVRAAVADEDTVVINLERERVKDCEPLLAAGTHIALCVCVFVHLLFNLLDNLVHPIFHSVDSRAVVDVIISAVYGALLVLALFGLGVDREHAVFFKFSA